ncbi:uncharacterized protein LOC110441284 [Mizuhopecten yessoensis]|uniref:Uncharacterized protein n=1 Tax=Mizuhopecten yessoensis TaxID=6573 RepID=A0A210PJM9_MIZYE|nr:uncharacterized protein LOC110441284 [Mizuhopecten yessoensis]OWF36698.1 hypothetical protein KP79_PYT02986 [Mizuhopecten yessoensis]
MGPARNTEFSCEYKSHQNKVDENQRRHQKADLKSDTVENTGISDTCRRSLLSQRSLSDSAIYKGVDVDDNKTRTCGKYEHSERKQVKTSSSKDNIECKAKRSLWSRIAKCIVKNSKQTSTEHLNWQTKLVCACGGSCERIDSLALSSDGHIWVSFLHCSWVSVYVHEYIPVRKFDAGCIVDCPAVSPAGVLYISCPMKKQILMLSKNLELIIMGQFNKLHPRGLAISPIDGAVVACMTSQMVGNVMKGPSKNCLMKFPGKKANEKGQVLNKEHFLGYPLRLAINVNGYILVSDFGLKCIFVVSQEGHMLNVFSTVGDRLFCQVHSLTSGHGESFYVVHGGRGQLSITRLGEYRGTVVETATSRRLDPDIYCKVRATAVVQNGQLAVTSGTIIKYVSPD